MNLKKRVEELEKAYKDTKYKAKAIIQVKVLHGSTIHETCLVEDEVNKFLTEMQSKDKGFRILDIRFQISESSDTNAMDEGVLLVYSIDQA